MDGSGHGQDWSEEFQILYEYDPVITECHDELRALGDEIAERFRNEVVGDRANPRKSPPASSPNSPRTSRLMSRPLVLA